MTPFEGGGVWLRCALHAHTTNSDGEMAPEMLVRHYEWAGYDVLAITDHWVRTVERSTRKLLVIPSTELNAVGAGDDAHVLALGVASGSRTPRRVRAAARGHRVDPGKQRRSLSRAHVLERSAHARLGVVRGLVGIEVWNTGCELEIGRGDSSLHWDEALEAGHALYALATDDSHHPGYDSGFAWTMVRAADGRRRPFSTHCVAAGSTGRRGRRSTMWNTTTTRSSSVLAGGERDARQRAASRRAGERRAARLSERVDDRRARRATASSPPAGSKSRRSRRTVGSRCATSTGHKAWTNPLWTSA